MKKIATLLVLVLGLFILFWFLKKTKAEVPSWKKPYGAGERVLEEAPPEELALQPPEGPMGPVYPV